MKTNRSCAVSIAVGITVLCLASAAAAEDPYEVAWATQVGTPSSEGSRSVAVDAAGNAYISGYTYGDLGGPNAGGTDAFVTKLDTTGNIIWTSQIGTSEHDYSNSVAVDAVGNVYVAGDVFGSSIATSDVFLTKLDPSGGELWSKQLGTSTRDQGLAVSVTAAGNVCISGFTGGDLVGASAGGNDAFVATFNSSGDQLWARQIGTSVNDVSFSVLASESGHIYISGYTKGDLGGANAGETDAFLTKLDSSGEEVWSRQIGLYGSDGSRATAVDSLGNVYISGYSTGRAFLAKFDSAGNEMWWNRLDGGQSRSVAVDAYGNAYMCSDNQHATGVDNTDSFLTKFDPSGLELWSQPLATPGEDYAYSVATDGSGGVYISGYTQGDLAGTNAGIGDAFLIKYESPIPEPATMSLLALGGVALLRRRK